LGYNHLMMLSSLSHVLLKECLLKPNGVILAGVSGGPDSLCLLDLLHLLGYPVLAAHLNHGLRPEAVEDARLVQQVAEQRGIRFLLEEVDTAAYAAQHNLSIEEAARTLRYAFLFEQAQKYGAQAVAVGHTADDQVETVLMHLLRGSGLSGLKGMPYRALPNPWSQEVPLVRPLLGIWRAEVIAYCAQRGLQPAIDRTNLDVTYFRNRLRYELIPTLEGYNPRIRQAVLRMAQVLAGDEELVRQVIDAAWQACMMKQGPGYVAFRLSTFRQQPYAVQRSLIRRAIEAQRPGLRDIYFDDVERALAFVESPPHSAHSDLAAGLRLYLEGDLLWLAAWESDLPGEDWPAVPQGVPLELAVPGRVELEGRWIVGAEWEDLPLLGNPFELVDEDPYQAWLDAEALQLPLVVRSRQPGDRIQPLGMEGKSIKLSDLMINQKLPRRARRAWPLVCAGSEVVWAPGLRMNDAYRLRPETRRVVHLYLKQ
jgi:tRNA(Ile)-lysidine synthase